MLGDLFYGRMFFAPDGDGGGAGGADAGDAGQGDGGDQQGQQGDEPAKPKPAPDTSANRLIKDFVAARGITVEDLLKQVAAGEDAARTDLEKAATERDRERQRAEAAEQKLRTANGKSAVISAATTANAISANAVFALVQPHLEFDDDGEPTNVEDVIAAAIKAEPQLFRASAGRADGSSRTTKDDPDVTPGLGRLSHAYKTTSKTASRG